MTTTLLRRITSGAGLCAVLMFFLPWMLVSCGAGGGGIDASGLEMATGNFDEFESISQLGAFFGEQDIGQAEPTPIFWLFPLFGLLGLAALNDKRSGAQVALAGGILGIIGLILFAVVLETQTDEIGLYGFQVKYMSGYLGSWLAFLVQSAGAYFLLQGGLPWEVQERESIIPDYASPADRPPIPVPDAAPPLVAVEALARLEFTAGPLSGQTMGITDTDVLIGRSSVCDIRIPDTTVSRQHARLRHAQGSWFIQDQESGRGTIVNGQQIQASRINAGDRLELGDTMLLFREG